MRRGVLLRRALPALGATMLVAGVLAAPAAKAQLGTGDVDLVTGPETLPHVSQNETMTAVNGTTVVVVYNDLRDPDEGVGFSVSHDSGLTFTRLDPSPVSTGHGDVEGDPYVVYDRKLGKFFAGGLSDDCGGEGVGLWSSSDGDNWSAAGCAIPSHDDRPSLAVDNNPSSSTYGRLYASTNNTDSTPSGVIDVAYSDDGTNWSAPVPLTTSFVRNVQVAVARDASPGGSSRVFVVADDEGGGGMATGAQNYIFHSDDGGDTWNTPAQAKVGQPTFSNPGEGTNCPSPHDPFWPTMGGNWREFGWGNIAVGPNGLVMYDYAVLGAAGDPGDIVVVRSTDNGNTWAAPVKLNTDVTTRAQWMPSLAVTASGDVVATWYDRRNTANNDYQRYGRVSTDGGVTWGPDQPVSDVIIPQPNQPDSADSPCNFGDYNDTIASGNVVFDSWTDGRVSIAPNGPQQDVFLDRIIASGPAAITQAAGAVRARTATLSGLANDNSKAGSARFEYGTTTAYGQTTPDLSLAASGGNLQVSRAISGLVPSTTYHFRLDAHNPDGDDAGADMTFTTPSGPNAITHAAADVGIDAATLNGLANDDSQAGSAHFEYGTTTAYGQTTPDVSLAASGSNQQVGQTIGGLAPATTYHFRLDARNPDGDDAGADMTFTTTAPPAPNQHRIAVTTDGPGSGSVTSGDGAIDCGSTCTHVFEDDDSVTLTATPDPGSVFAGWSGAGCSGTGSCEFTVSADEAITATFKPSSAFRFGHPTRNKRRGTAILSVIVPDSGEISLAGGNGVKPIAKRRRGKAVAEGGVVNLKVLPTGRAKRKLRAKHHARVRAKVTFTATGGDPVTRGKKLKLVRRRRPS